MTPLTLSQRRRLLDLTVTQLAYAARMSAASVLQPSPQAAARLAATLSVLEAGGSLADARAAALPGRTGPKSARATREHVPAWPQREAADPLPDGACFADIKLKGHARDG